jgi:LAO/AO transport system kinase
MSRLPELELAFAKRDVSALARAITEAERQNPLVWELLAKHYAKLGHARVVGITGPPGAGKSTLMANIATSLRKLHQTVGIVAIDPASPVTGGGCTRRSRSDGGAYG